MMANAPGFLRLRLVAAILLSLLWATMCVGLVSGERLAWFSESCGPLPDLGAAAP